MTDRDRKTRPLADGDDDSPFPEEGLGQFGDATVWSVGYGKPPQHTRFQKGKSGNPKGRPRKSGTAEPSVEPPPIRSMVLDEARRPVMVREGARSFEIPAKQAVLRAQMATAIKGSPHAQKYVLEQVERFEREEQGEIAKSHEIWQTYTSNCRMQIAEAEERGGPLPNLIPHPDDIVIEPGLPVRIDGPMDEGDAVRLNEHCRLRSTLLLQDELDRRLSAYSSEDRRPEDGSAHRPGSALVLALLLNDGLPKRWRLDDTRILREQMHYQTRTRRDLLKTLYGRWRSLGINVTRGQVFPPIAVAKSRFGLVLDLWTTAKQGRIDLKSMARGEFDERAQALMAGLSDMNGDAA